MGLATSLANARSYASDPAATAYRLRPALRRRRAGPHQVLDQLGAARFELASLRGTVQRPHRVVALTHYRRAVLVAAVRADAIGFPFQSHAAVRVTHRTQQIGRAAVAVFHFADLAVAVLNLGGELIESCGVFAAEVSVPGAGKEVGCLSAELVAFADQVVECGHDVLLSEVE